MKVTYQLVAPFAVTALFLGYQQKLTTTHIESESDVKDSGRLGDVKYSVLSPLEFRQYNGPGWVLMRPLVEDPQNSDGQLLRSYTAEDDPRRRYPEFFAASGLADIPDARGVFLRGMNAGRKGIFADPDSNRCVGDLQLDEFASHDHQGGDHTHEHGSSHWDNGGMHNSYRGYLAGGDQRQVTGFHAISKSGAIVMPEGGPETRPKNLALYVYIKIMP